MNLLDGLKQWSTVVADTGDIDSIREYKPRDATTNPSIILKTVSKYPEFLDKAKQIDPDGSIESLSVAIGSEILNVISGRVSTEVDACLSFDTAETINRAHRIIELYEKNHISRDRILIKIAATWEGIQAAKVLEQAGIHCNMTLIFSLIQAVACAEAGVTLISPFVGRILDWHKAHGAAENQVDPGVVSVKGINHYYKQFGYKTEVMAASFRNVDEILSLSGCDLLTINPKLLSELAQTEGVVEDNIMKRTEDFAQKLAFDESSFRFALNEDAMATEKLAEGIRMFCRDIRELKELKNK